jgi:hypothetical protein
VKVHKLMGGEFRRTHAVALWSIVKEHPRHLPTYLLYLIPGGILRYGQTIRVKLRQMFNSIKD